MELIHMQLYWQLPNNMSDKVAEELYRQLDESLEAELTNRTTDLEILRDLIRVAETIKL